MYEKSSSCSDVDCCNDQVGERMRRRGVQKCDRIEVILAYLLLVFHLRNLDLDSRAAGTLWMNVDMVSFLTGEISFIFKTASIDLMLLQPHTIWSNLIHVENCLGRRSS